MSPWWSWVLTSVGVFGLYLAGRRNRAGWAVGLGAQGLWVAYAVSTRQWGFLASAGAYGWVYARNWIRWRAEARATRGQDPCTGGHRLRRWRPWWPPFAPRRVACARCPFEVVEPAWTDG